MDQAVSEITGESHQAMRAELERKILALIQDNLGKTQVPVTLDCVLKNLGAKPLDIAHILVSVEKTFKIQLDHHDIGSDEHAHIITPRCIVNACCTLLASG